MSSLWNIPFLLLMAIKIGFTIRGGVAEGIAAELAGGRRTRIRAIEGFVPHGDAKALKQLLGFLPEQLADDLRGLEA